MEHVCTPLYRYNGERLKLEGEIVIDRRGMFALHDDDVRVERERRWVLLKIPRCDIDGVGEGK